MPSDIKLKYHWIIVSYNAIQEEKYVFTPWEREIFDIRKNTQIYLEHTPLDVTGNCIVYGIKDETYFNQELLYHIPGPTFENSVDLCCYQYTIISPEKYKITTSDKLAFDRETLQGYQYLIVDYLKKDSYSVNKKGARWEVEISSKENEYLIMYDSKDELVTTAFQTLSIDTLKTDDKIPLEEGDFVVLEAGL